MTRPVWLPAIAFALAVITWVLLTGYAHAAVHPDSEMPAIRPQPLADALPKKKDVCAKQTVIILYGADEGGKLVPFAVIRGPMEKCK